MLTARSFTTRQTTLKAVLHGPHDRSSDPRDPGNASDDRSDAISQPATSLYKAVGVTAPWLKIWRDLTGSSHTSPETNAARIVYSTDSNRAIPEHSSWTKLGEMPAANIRSRHNPLVQSLTGCTAAVTITTQGYRRAYNQRQLSASACTAAVQATATTASWKSHFQSAKSVLIQLFSSAVACLAQAFYDQKTKQTPKKFAARPKPRSLKTRG